LIKRAENKLLPLFFRAIKIRKSVSFLFFIEMVQRVAESTMDRESLVYKAKLAGQAERYDDMISIMKQVAHHAQGTLHLASPSKLAS